MNAPNPISPAELADAVAFAARLHASQVRKGTSIPYVSHLLAVAALVMEAGGNRDEILGGLLHDTAEDAGGHVTLGEVASRFGSVVAGIVRENSDSLTTTEEEKAPWHDRKRAYLAAIAHKSVSARLVSVCDKLHNARSLRQDQEEKGDAHWSRFNASKTDTIWYYRSLVEAFAAVQADDPRLVRPVRELAGEVERLASA